MSRGANDQAVNGGCNINYIKQSFVLVALLMSWAAGPLFGEDAGYFQSTDGMNVYIGILPVR